MPLGLFMLGDVRVVGRLMFYAVHILNDYIYFIIEIIHLTRRVE